MKKKFLILALVALAVLMSATAAYASASWSHPASATPPSSIPSVQQGAGLALTPNALNSTGGVGDCTLFAHDPFKSGGYLYGEGMLSCGRNENLQMRTCVQTLGGGGWITSHCDFLGSGSASGLTDYVSAINPTWNTEYRSWVWGYANGATSVVTSNGTWWFG